MNSIFRSIIIVLFCAIGTQVNAQLSYLQKATGDIITKSGEYVKVEGTPYLLADWSPGIVIDTRDNTQIPVLLKYDIYKHELEVLNNGKRLILDQSIYSVFKVEMREGDESKSYLFKSGLNVMGDQKGYYNVLHEDKYLLVKGYRTRIIETTSAGYGTNERTKTFKNKEELYLKAPGSEVFISVQLKKKAIIKLFENDKKVSDYISKEKLKFKSEEDLIKLLKYLDN